MPEVRSILTACSILHVVHQSQDRLSQDPISTTLYVRPWNRGVNPGFLQAFRGHKRREMGVAMSQGFHATDGRTPHAAPAGQQSNFWWNADEIGNRCYHMPINEPDSAVTRLAAAPTTAVDPPMHTG